MHVHTKPVPKNNAENNINYIRAAASKNHFAVLDGLRGVAALSVLVFHFMSIIAHHGAYHFIAHAYLAVDFFFCLSGFVIAYAYDTRLEQMGIFHFLKLRIFRLHPLVLIMSIIGLLAFMFDPFSDLAHQYAGQMIPLFLSSCLMIPYPVVKERFYDFFHLNAAMWSLMWEYAANIAYALVLIRVSRRVLGVMAALAAMLVLYRSYQSGQLSGGWGRGNFWDGGIRILYSFTAGMLVYRCKWIIRSSLGFTGLSVMLLGAFLLPVFTAGNFILDTFLVVLYFPFLVALGAGAALRPSLVKLCRWAAELSYPLYMVHSPFVWWFLSWTERVKPSVIEMTLVMTGSAVMLIALSYVIYNYFDVPVRSYLRRFA